jgi:hypothetical protein
MREDTKMANAEAIVVVQRSASEVFAFIANGANNPRWRSGVLDIARVEGTPDGVGARYRQGTAGPFGMRIAADYEVTEYEPDRRLTFRVVAGPARPEGVFELSPSDGGTQLRFGLRWEPSGVRRLLEGQVQRTMEEEVGRLAVLKRVLEGA